MTDKEQNEGRSAEGEGQDGDINDPLTSRDGEAHQTPFESEPDT